MCRKNTVSLVTMAEGSHPFPFRTRKLSPPAPMVLPSGGRVGRRQAFFCAHRVSCGYKKASHDDPWARYVPQAVAEERTGEQLRSNCFVARLFFAMGADPRYADAENRWGCLERGQLEAMETAVAEFHEQILSY